MERPSLLSNAEVEPPLLINATVGAVAQPKMIHPLTASRVASLRHSRLENDVPVSNRHKLTVEKSSASSKFG